QLEAGFRWLKKNVKSDFVVNIDSDTVAHIDRFMIKNVIIFCRNLANDFFLCDRLEHSPVIRDERSPWYVSYSDYAPSLFPQYCSGTGYAMMRRTFDKVVDHMCNFKVFEVEDAFFTGVVTEDLNALIVPGAVASKY
ncbi:hypothetical protein PENTCL1PPCAC_19106, partial [Pristionchus entomophagus]